MIAVTPKLPGENMKNYAYRLVKKAIMSLRLQPGQFLSEVELAELLNTSRTPIREVLAKLKEEHLIEVYPQIGTYVSKINFQLIEEATFMRFILEKEVLKLSCQNFSKQSLYELKRNAAQQEELKNSVENVQEFHALDKQFHFLIFKENKMEHIWEEILRISTHYNRMRLLSEMNNHFEEAITQHKDIIRLIESQDIQSVDTVAYKHIIEPKKHWNTFAEENNPYSHYFV